jgi:transcriptional regulator with XRE-family HTH domain
VEGHDRASAAQHKKTLEESWMQGNGEFGALLRTFRERLSPERAGIQPTWPAERRVPGLRRDELARLASVSEEHLKRLEQGRRRPSRAVVDALAGALGLDPHAHARFSLVAGFAAPGGGLALQPVAPGAAQDWPPPDAEDAGHGGRVPRQITAPARRLLERLGEVPFYVCDASWTVLENNRSWAELEGGCDLLGAGVHGTNVAWRLFTSPPTAWMASAEQSSKVRSFLVADLRAAVRRYPADPQLRDLVADLQAASEDFARLWAAQVAGRQHTEQVMTRDGPSGHIQVRKDVLTIEPGDLRVVIVAGTDRSSNASRAVGSAQPA